MTTKAELREIAQQQLLDETKAYLDELQTVLWDLNLGIALLVYDPDNFGLVTNSIPKVEAFAEQFMTTWSRYRQCEATTAAITEAYDRYLDDEAGEDYDFDNTVYESMQEVLRRLKSSYDLQGDVFAEQFFWAIRFADPTSEQREFASNAFRELNSPELYSRFKGVSN